MHYPRVAEYRQLDRNGWPRSNRKTVATVDQGGRRYYLVHGTAGYETAGSTARWTDEYWAVEFLVDGARHGRRFRTEAEARVLFEKCTQAC